MKPRNPTLAIILTVAVLGSLALLIDALVKEIRGPGDVELSERPARVREARVRPARAWREVLPVREAGTIEAAAIVASEKEAESTSMAESTTTLVDSTPPIHARPWDAREDSRQVVESSPGTDVSLTYATGVPSVIATYLLQFATASHWPSGVPPAGVPFAIGVLRDDTFRGIAAGVLQGKRVGNLVVAVVGGESPEALAACPIVFVGDLVHAEDARAFFAGRPTMMVTYAAADLRDTWCDIEFIWLDGRLGFAVDRAALLQDDITVNDVLFSFENAFVRKGGGPIMRVLNATYPTRTRFELP